MILQSSSQQSPIQVVAAGTTHSLNLKRELQSKHRVHLLKPHAMQRSQSSTRSLSITSLRFGSPRHAVDSWSWCYSLLFDNVILGIDMSLMGFKKCGGLALVPPSYAIVC